MNTFHDFHLRTWARFWSRRVMAEKFSLGIEGAYLAQMRALVLAGLPTTSTLTLFLACWSRAWPCGKWRHLEWLILFWLWFKTNLKSRKWSCDYFCIWLWYKTEAGRCKQCSEWCMIIAPVYVYIKNVNKKIGFSTYACYWIGNRN